MQRVIRRFLWGRSCNNLLQTKFPSWIIEVSVANICDGYGGGKCEKKAELEAAAAPGLPLLHFLPGNHVDGKNWCEMDSEKQRIESGQSAKLVIRDSPNESLTLEK